MASRHTFRAFPAKLIPVIGLVVLAIAFTGCPQKQPGNQPAQKQVPELKIGAVMPRSGQIAAFGDETKQGIDMAVEQASSRLAGKLNISVTYEDSKGLPEETVRGFRKLVDIDKVQVVIGEVISPNTAAIVDIAQDGHIPLVLTSATNKDLTVNRNYVLRVCFIDPQQGTAMADFAFNELGIRKAAILFDKGSDYSAGLTEAFRTAFKALGGTIVGENNLRPEDQDFRAQLIQARDWTPDALFLPVNYPQAAQALLQAKEVGLNCKFLGGDGWASPELFQIGHEAVTGAYITAHFAADNASGRVAQFVNDFKAKYGTEPSSFAALGFDAADIVIQAASNLPSITSEALRTALFNIKDYPGATGTITIGADGNPVKDIVVLETTANGFKFVKSIVPTTAVPTSTPPTGSAAPPKETP